MRRSAQRCDAGPGSRAAADRALTARDPVSAQQHFMLQRARDDAGCGGKVRDRGLRVSHQLALRSLRNISVIPGRDEIANPDSMTASPRDGFWVPRVARPRNDGGSKAPPFDRNRRADEIRRLRLTAATHGGFHPPYGFFPLIFHPGRIAAHPSRRPQERPPQDEDGERCDKGLPHPEERPLGRVAKDGPPAPVGFAARAVCFRKSSLCVSRIVIRRVH